MSFNNMKRVNLLVVSSVVVISLVVGLVLALDFFKIKFNGKLDGSNVFNFETKKISFTDKKMEINVEYPSFSGRDFAVLNESIRQIIEPASVNFRGDVEKSDSASELYRSSLDGGYKIVEMTPHFLAIQFSFIWYYAGAAHPNSYTKTLNFDLDNNKVFALSDLFQRGSDWLPVVAGLARSEVKKKFNYDDAVDANWLEGTTAKAENFQNFLIRKNGLELVFDPYQVSPYAAGMTELTLPWAQLPVKKELMARLQLNDSNNTAEPAPIGLGNPASENCTAKGGTTEIVKRPDGSEYGKCFFEDNRQCEEWALFRDECPVGGLKITGYENESQIYCAITGGEVLMVDGYCQLAGNLCKFVDYYSGACNPKDENFHNDSGAAQLAIKDTAQQVVDSLKLKDWKKLSEFVNESVGLTFHPYVNANIEAKRMNKSELLNVAKDKAVYLWGDYDGSGLPINLSFGDYYNKFIFNHDFTVAPQVLYNEPISRGNLIDNLSDYYRGSIIVEYYFPGFEKKYEGLDWASLKLIFRNYDGRWYLVGIAHGQWTI